MKSQLRMSSVEPVTEDCKFASSDSTKTVISCSVWKRDSWGLFKSMSLRILLCIFWAGAVRSIWIRSTT